MEFAKYHSILILLKITLISIIFITLGKYLSYSIWQTNLTHHNTTNDSLNNVVNTEVLLIYVYSNTHQDAFGNLEYFINVAVRENDGVDYYFILQRVDNKTINESEMPLLPKKNGRYIQHDNICFDFGTFGWFFNEFTFGNPWINQTISSNKINLNKYKYFILMNSSIRGPYFPPYFIKFLSDYKNEFFWYHAFTKFINSKVKLVGSTISCIPIPHIQSYILVTDFIGLTLMLQPGSGGGSTEEGIFGCHAIKIHASFHSEVPSSTRILEANYMIGGLLTKYQGVNFNEDRNRLCNGHKDPHLDDNLDGTSLEPYEVVFIKYNDRPWLHFPKDRAILYDKWIHDTQKQNRLIW